MRNMKILHLWLRKFLQSKINLSNSSEVVLATCLNGKYQPSIFRDLNILRYDPTDNEFIVNIFEQLANLLLDDFNGLDALTG